MGAVARIPKQYRKFETHQPTSPAAYRSLPPPPSPAPFLPIAPRPQAHCAHGPNAGEFSSVPSVVWRDVEPPLKLRLQVAYTLTFSGEAAGRALAARDGLISAIMRALAEGGASYSTGDSQPVRVKLE